MVDEIANFLRKTLKNGSKDTNYKIQDGNWRSFAFGSLGAKI